MSDQHLLNQKQQQKFITISSVLKQQITNGQAAKMLNISIRQIQRLKIAVKKHGVGILMHGLRGKKSNHAIDKNIKKQAIEEIREKYPDFKPGFAAEKLQEQNRFKITSQTIRVWMTEEGLWKPHKQKKTRSYRSWRPRKEYFGEMQQFDGSYHYWFEKRYCDENLEPIEVCLLAAIDDATGKITKAQFGSNEGVVAVFQFWKEYILKFGKPIFIYLDKFSTYKINHKSALDNHELITQFQRATQALGIKLITAHSPEAKGRVERLFQTLQDRLVKELRLSNINNPEDGNRFLEEEFLIKFNNRFSVIPTKEGNVHKNLSEADKRSLNRVFSIQSTRRVNNDFTIQFKNRWYQLAELQPTTVRTREKILVEEWVNETIHFSLREEYLRYTVLPERPKKVTKEQPLILTTHRLNYKPPLNHPWRQYAKVNY